MDEALCSVAGNTVSRRNLLGQPHIHVLTQLTSCEILSTVEPLVASKQVGFSPSLDVLCIASWQFLLNVFLQELVSKQWCAHTQWHMLVVRQECPKPFLSAFCYLMFCNPSLLYWSPHLHQHVWKGNGFASLSHRPTPWAPSKTQTTNLRFSQILNEPHFGSNRAWFIGA